MATMSTSPSPPASVPAQPPAIKQQQQMHTGDDDDGDDDDGSELSELSDISDISELSGPAPLLSDDEDDEDVDMATDDEGGGEAMWEATESLLEDAVESLITEKFEPEDDVVTQEERKELRMLLKRRGEEGFIQDVIVPGKMTIRKCLTAFNVRPPSFLEEAPDKALLQLLRVVLEREMMRRSRLPHINSIDHVVDLLKRSKDIIVLTGAGISTSLGIPDFRSKGSGLYSRLEGLGLSDPQEVFDIDLFNDDPTVFYSIAKDILPTTQTFSPTHAFIALLQTKNKLLTQYTQNIDNLEMLAGISPDKLIQCHGSFASASCVKCKHRVPGENIFPELKRGVVAKCDNCLKMLAESSAAGKKRKGAKGSDTWKKKRTKNSEHWKKKRYSEDSSAEEEEINFREAGVMKPDITFFGEQLPDTFHQRLLEHDRTKADLLICIGTSLKVAPVSEIIGILPAHVPQIYISKTPVNHIEFDVELLGSADGIVAELCRLAGWTLKHEMLPKHRTEVEWVRVEGPGNRFEFTPVMV